MDKKKLEVHIWLYLVAAVLFFICGMQTKFPLLFIASISSVIRAISAILKYHRMDDD